MITSDTNFRGNFDSIEAVWEAIPYGGVEGDYLNIQGVKYRWNKYLAMWENAEVVTETPARETVTFDEDVNMQNNLTVAGVLRAKKFVVEDLPTGIEEVEITESAVSGGNNVITFTYTNGESQTFNVKNGEAGKTMGAFGYASSTSSQSTWDTAKNYLVPTANEGEFDVYTYEGDAWYQVDTFQVDIAGTAGAVEYDDTTTQLGADNVQEAIEAVTDEINVVASDNVFSADADLEIQDENENVLARFSQGEFKTKNFDSRDVPMIESARVPLDVADDNGFVIVRFENGHIMTRNFDSSQIFIPRSNLYQKKMCIIGDSYVANHNQSYTLTWHYKIAQENEMAYVNYGINGNGIVGNATGTPIVDRYTSMDDDADYVLVVGGKNDYNVQISIANFKSGLATLCAGLIGKYAARGTKIAFFTPWDDYDSGTDPNTIKLIEYVDAIKEVCGKYSIPVFDSSRESSMYMFNSTFRSTYCQSSTDISHLNAAGHLLFKNRAFNFLNQL